MKTALTFCLSLLLITACQQGPSNSRPSPSPRTSPTPTPISTPIPTPTPSPSADNSGVLVNPSIHSGCDGAAILCAEGTPCALPSCLPSPPPLRQDAPLFIEESRYDALKTRFGLFSVSRAEDTLGGLSPQLPIAKGLKANCSAGEGLYSNGGRLNACVVYIVQTGSDFVLLSTPADVRARFAPVETPEEAVSFAAMLTGDEPRYELDLDQSWRFYASSITPTRVSQNGDAYSLTLFDYQFFGCGPHPYFSIGYSVSHGGEVRETSRNKAFEDPAKDGLCVD
ncbi:MAG TPA: hypothetical protein V6D23_08010 [Candidatus Obscuribacterales bacterium]